MRKADRAKFEHLLDDLHRRFIVINDDVHIGTYDINLIRPRSAEDLINEQDFELDERLPYWAELWPSSTILANFLVTRSLPPSRGLELGCGIGMVSLAAAIAGHTMLATDYYADALLFTKANVYRNLGREIDTRMVDWRAMPEDTGTFDLVLASDVLYESSYADIVSEAINKTLSVNGKAYIADPGRVAAHAFIDACARLGIVVASKTEHPYLAGKVRQTITVYELIRTVSPLSSRDPYTREEKTR